MWMVSSVEILLMYSPHISGSLLDVSSIIVISRILFMPTGMYGVSKRCPSQQHFFICLDEKFMPALATGLTVLVD